MNYFKACCRLASANKIFSVRSCIEISSTSVPWRCLLGARKGICSWNLLCTIHGATVNRLALTNQKSSKHMWVLKWNCLNCSSKLYDVECLQCLPFVDSCFGRRSRAVLLARSRPRWLHSESSDNWFLAIETSSGFQTLNRTPLTSFRWAVSYSGRWFSEIFGAKDKWEI